MRELRELFKYNGKTYEALTDIPESTQQASHIRYKDEDGIDVLEWTYEDNTNYVAQQLERKTQYWRHQREIVCFPIINRGTIWYNTLTQEQKDELSIWYQDWLDITVDINLEEMPIIPEYPNWL